MNSTAERKWVTGGSKTIPRHVGEFWTSKQRQASSIHEISYRACFKPQLPRYFIERYSAEGNVVYDPFMGRGTTLIEAALMNRNVIGNDVNPLSRILTEPRLNIPTLDEVERRLSKITMSKKLKANIDLSMFFHPDTEAEIVSLQKYLAKRKKERKEDSIDRWIRMVATNRLTGHSSGFFSVYTLPPNQAASPENQKRINATRKQKPAYRNVKEIISKKTRTLLKRIGEEERAVVNAAGSSARFLTADARKTRAIQGESVQLTVTSPPFLNIVQYSQDNWLRGWFNMIDPATVRITLARTVKEWNGVMSGVFQELYRITRGGGYVAFEVGEVRNGTVKLDEHVIPIGLAAGFHCEGIYINTQKFTKTANIWGIHNNTLGTNTNRIVLFRKCHEGNS
jgi:DNA methylase